MTKSSVAVLIDAGFIWRTGRRFLNRPWTLNDIIAMSMACLKESESIFRIFFYDCLPFDGTRPHPVSKSAINYAETEFSQHEFRDITE